MYLLKVLSIAFLLCILGCTPKNGKQAVEKAEAEARKSMSIKVGELKGRGGKISAKKTVLKKVFSDRYKTVRNFNDYRITSFNDAVFYLVAKGTEDDNANALMGIELEIKEGGLYVERRNKLEHKCITRYCLACAFKPGPRGTIQDCECAKGEDNPTEDMASCEYRVVIKTLEGGKDKDRHSN